MSGNRSLIEEREQQLAEARALRQGYQQSGTFHAQGTRGGRSKPRAPGRRALQAGGQGRGGMRTTSRMTAGNGMYMGPEAQRHSNQVSAGGYRPPLTGNRGTEHHSAQVAPRANVVTAPEGASQPETRVVSYYQDNDNDTPGVASTTTVTVAHPAAIPALAALVADTPVMTAGGLSQAASVTPTASAAPKLDGFAFQPASQTAAQSSSASDWNTAQPANGADTFTFDSGFGSRLGSVAVPATGQPFVAPSAPVAVATTARLSCAPSVPIAVTNSNTLSAGRPAPNTVWHWNYQDVTAGPEIIPVELVAAADGDAMDIDDNTPSPPENGGIWNRPAKKRIPCTCSARGLGHSRWAEPSVITPTSPGRFPYEPQAGKSGGLCPIHGKKNNSQSGDGHGHGFTGTTGNDCGGHYY